MRRITNIVLVVMLAAAASACQEDGTVVVHSLTFKGVNHIDLARLKAVLATRENARIPVVGGRLPWWKTASFDRGRFDADLKRIEAFYADRGYPDARVASFDVKLNEKQDAVDVTLTIEEGAPVAVEAVGYRGFEVLPPERLARVQTASPLVVGRARDRQDVTTAHELAVNELRDQGYPYAKVATVESDGADGRSATITFTAEPGTLAHFGSVQIAGNRSVGQRIIERQLTFKPGDLYRRSDLQESQRRLYQMQLFQFVNVEPLTSEEQPPELNTRVTVAEGKHQRVNFGIGYGTEEKARAEGEYHHLNFLGGARTAGLHARWSSLDRGVRADITQPYFFDPSLSLGVEGQKWYTYTPAYSSVVTGARGTLVHRRSASFSWSVSLSSERDSSSVEQSALEDPELYLDLIALGLNPITGKQEGTIGAVGFDLQRNTADNVLNPRKGYQFALHSEAAGLLFPSDFHFRALSLDGRHYLPLGTRLVLANRVQMGAINGAGDDPTQVPFAKKFFLGGATTIRGWGRYEVSPLSSGLPIGGNTMLAFNSEARLTLGGSLSSVAFLDAGNVWEGDWQIVLNDLRYAVGTGLRYQTPVGPIRLDAGYQLNPIPDLLIDGKPQARRWRIHFSIGQAF